MKSSPKSNASCLLFLLCCCWLSSTSTTHAVKVFSSSGRQVLHEQQETNPQQEQAEEQQQQQQVDLSSSSSSWSSTYSSDITTAHSQSRSSFLASQRRKQYTTKSSGGSFTKNNNKRVLLETATTVYDLADKTFVKKGDVLKVSTKGGVRRLVSDPVCRKFSTFVYKSDIEDALIKTADGYSFQVDLYLNSNKKQPVGKWLEAINYTDNGEGREGVGTVSVTFNLNASISFAAVLGQRQYPITGGSGTFGHCAGGYAELLYDRIDKFMWDINVCETCVPDL